MERAPLPYLPSSRAQTRSRSPTAHVSPVGGLLGPCLVGWRPPLGHCAAGAVPCVGWMWLWARCAPLGAAGRRGGSSCPARGSQAAAAVLLAKASLGSGVHRAPAPQAGEGHSPCLSTQVSRVPACGSHSGPPAVPALLSVVSCLCQAGVVFSLRHDRPLWIGRGICGDTLGTKRPVRISRPCCSQDCVPGPPGAGTSSWVLSRLLRAPLQSSSCWGNSSGRYFWCGSMACAQLQQRGEILASRSTAGFFWTGPHRESKSAQKREHLGLGTSCPAAGKCARLVLPPALLLSALLGSVGAGGALPHTSLLRGAARCWPLCHHAQCPQNMQCASCCTLRVHSSPPRCVPPPPIFPARVLICEINTLILPRNEHHLLLSLINSLNLGVAEERLNVLLERLRVSPWYYEPAVPCQAKQHSGCFLGDL